jgi:hypothetical protein
MDNIGWFAGMFDGEGCITLFRTSKHGKYISHHMQVCVTNTNVEALVKFQEKFGGKIQKHHGKNNCYRWYLAGRDQMRNLLKTILPYCLIKKPQMEIALVYLETVKDTNAYFGFNNRITPEVFKKRDEILNELQRMKRVHLTDSLVEI